MTTYCSGALVQELEAQWANEVLEPEVVGVSECSHVPTEHTASLHLLSLLTFISLLWEQKLAHDCVHHPQLFVPLQCLLADTHTALGLFPLLILGSIYWVYLLWGFNFDGVQLESFLITLLSVCSD